MQKSGPQDLSLEQKTVIQELIVQTRKEIAKGEFRPAKYTDPRGMRLFTMVPICSMSMRYIQIDKQALLRLVSNIPIGNSEKDYMKKMCSSIFKMSKIGFSDC
jgi:hypothetical protein